MKTNFITFLFFALSIANCGLSQKKEKEPKINYKIEILPLIESSKVEEAIPLLKKYFNQNLILGEIWNPKVMLLEANYMYNAEKTLAVNYDNKAFSSLSVALADTSIFWYKRMLSDRHSDSLMAKDRLVALNNAKIAFPIQLAENQKQKELEEVRRKKFVADSIEQDRIAKEKRASFIQDSLNNAKAIQQELDDYNLAKKLDKLSNYKSFLKKYPNSNYFFEIDTLCSLVALRKADSVHTIVGYKEFMDSFPSSIYSSVALEKMLRLVCPSNISAIIKLSEVNKSLNEIRILNNKYHLGLGFDKLNQFNTIDLNSGKWIYKNLNVSHFANGDTIPQAKSKEDWIKASKDKKPVWCYYDNKPENADYKGKLYNWYAVSDPRGLSSVNYNVPSSEEYAQLINEAGGSSSAGLNLKCSFSWQEEGNQEESINNYLGFDCSPEGYRDEQGNFIAKNEGARFWTNTERGEMADFIGFVKNSNGCILGDFAPKGSGFSVRLKSFYEDSEYTYSNLLDSLIQKRDEILLKEYGSIKDFKKIDAFLFNQIKSELGIKHLLPSEISQAQFAILINRFYNNENNIKNGNFLVPPYYEDNFICGGEGYSDDPNPQIINGYKDNIQNFIKWSDGSSYSGEIVNGFPNGKGLITFPNGTKQAGLFVDGEFQRNILGTYKNKAGQTLTISNKTDCCFDFKIKWGVNDSWGCVFEAQGSANLNSSEDAYYGETSENSNISFQFSDNKVSITAGYEFIGGECAKFGDSQTDKFTTFTKQ
jgi:uncharacterized protein (TIGR02145 family)